MASSESKIRTLLVWHVEDDPFERERVAKALSQGVLEYTFELKSFAEAPRGILPKVSPDIWLIDLFLKDEISGLDLLKTLKAGHQNAALLVISQADDAATICKAMESGADDFLSKSSDHAELALRIVQSWRLARGELRASSLNSNHKSIAVGRTMEQVRRRMPQIIQSAITSIFIAGESGTGKEVVADLLREALPPSTPLIRVNCGAIAPTLLESELFGHVKGSFTGASTDKKGFVEAAHGGWLFLDEIATLSAQAQVALLRVLESREVQRVGSTVTNKIDVRIMAATHEDMSRLVKEGRFRGDLWQRLREAEIELPPLRSRPDEIEPLIKYFCASMAGGPYEISPTALEVLCHATWHEGNIRELRNVLRAMTESHADRRLTPLSIPSRVWKDSESNETLRQHDGPSSAPDLSPKVEFKLSTQGDGEWNFEELCERLLIELIRAASNQEGKKVTLRGMARLIGMSRSTLSDRLRAVASHGRISMTELTQLINVADPLSKSKED